MKNLQGYDGPSLRDNVFRQIEGAILSGEFSLGESLAEVKLSTQLGVSRTPVREALRQLELEGLVKAIPNKGAVVVGVSEKDIKDIYSIRMAIEGLCAKWAAENITDEEIEKMQEVIELQDFYAEKEDVIQVWHLDSRFHELLYAASKSRPLQFMLSCFHNYIQKARAVSIKTYGRTTCAIKEHKEIFLAVKAHDLDMAEKKAYTHIKNAMENILHNIDEERKA